MCDGQPSFSFSHWPGCLPSQSGYSLESGIPCKDGALGAFFSSAASYSPHHSGLGSSCPASFLCALSLAAVNQGKFNYHWLPACLPPCHQLMVFSLASCPKAEPICWEISQSLCRLLRSLHQSQNLTVQRMEFRHLVGLGVGLDIESSPWQSLVLPPFYVIIFPASVKCSSQTTSSQPFQPNCLPQRHLTWKY